MKVGGIFEINAVTLHSQGKKAPAFKNSHPSWSTRLPAGKNPQPPFGAFCLMHGQ